MRMHQYQYDINTLIAKDEAGLISSFALQLDSILTDGEPLNETGLKVLDEALKVLNELASLSTKDCTDDYEEGYRDGFTDAENGFNSKISGWWINEAT